MTSVSSGELSVLPQSVQMLYGMYRKNRFRVNRRYQRKLVWSVEEKQRLIDSILKGLPIPLFLVAEIGPPPDAPYEIVDGMQRLNAIFSFLENEYPVDGKFFDLDALADTKSRKDEGRLTQLQPVLTRAESVNLANYSVALSVFRAPDSASVDDVFRRINSGGRRLLRQELRQAGTTSLLADLVRLISSKIRTDTSPGDIVPLEHMPELSITNRDLNYGVPADEIFWVREGILRREEVRSSLDEQAVLDLVIDCFIEPTPNSGTRIRDDYYDFSYNQEEQPSPESITITRAIENYGFQKYQDDFLRVYDEIRAVLRTADNRFSALIDAGSGGRSPRYFHLIFMAMYELIFRDHMTIKDRRLLADKLHGIGKSAARVPGGGGDWMRTAKRKSIDSVKGVIRVAFEKTTGPEDYSQYGWTSQLETLLGNAIIEHPSFDCKQGLLRLDQQRTPDTAALRSICRTLTAMANRGPGAIGHVVIGIVDKDSDAKRVEDLDGVSPVKYKRYSVVGIEREAVITRVTLNDYCSRIIKRIRDMPGFDRELGKQVATDFRVIDYYGRAVMLLRVQGKHQPAFFDGVMVDRLGSDTNDVEQADFMRIYERFAISSRDADYARI